MAPKNKRGREKEMGRTEISWGKKRLEPLEGIDTVVDRPSSDHGDVNFGNSQVKPMFIPARVYKEWLNSRQEDEFDSEGDEQAEVEPTHETIKREFHDKPIVNEEIEESFDADDLLTEDSYSEEEEDEDEWSSNNPDSSSEEEDVEPLKPMYDSIKSVNASNDVELMSNFIKKAKGEADAEAFDSTQPRDVERKPNLATPSRWRGYFDN